MKTELLFVYLCMEKHELQKLVDEHLSTREIGRKIGKSQSSVKHWLKKYGLKTNKTRIETDTITCKKCFKQGTRDDFYSNKSKRPSYCKICSNILVLQRTRLNKIKAIQYKGGCCEKCGYSKCNGALHFHHINPDEKDINWNVFKNRKLDNKLKAELDKCMLLCANCHAEVHYNV